MVVSRQGTSRTDEQLSAMLDDAAEWVVKGRLGEAIVTTATLRHAIINARRLRSARPVTALVCHTPETVSVFYGQIDRLISLHCAGEAPPKPNPTSLHT